MTTRITELALEAGLLNYVDNETPRQYFVDGHAHNEEVEKFAELIVRKCAEIAETAEPYQSHDNILRHFGFK